MAATFLINQSLNNTLKHLAMKKTKKIYRKVGQLVAHKGTNENAHIIYVATIVEFEYLIIWVKDDKGNLYAINEWNLCPMPKLTKTPF